MTTTNSFDVHAFLEERRQVAIVWSVPDVHSVRPDLSDAEAWEVLQRCCRVHDCNLGFTWDLIEMVAQSMFPISD